MPRQGKIHPVMLRYIISELNRSGQGYNTSCQGKIDHGRAR
jgi:hypothetical protein